MKKKMNTYTTQQFIQLEKEVWEALAAGNIEADSKLLADDFLGVYPSGFAKKSDHTNQLKVGSTVLQYEILEARIKVLSEEVVLLSYLANYVPSNGGKESMYVTSIWQSMNGVWKNVFSQDTPFEN